MRLMSDELPGAESAGLFSDVLRTRNSVALSQQSKAGETPAPQPAGRPALRGGWAEAARGSGVEILVRGLPDDG
jgi:hypothetical protein